MKPDASSQSATNRRRFIKYSGAVLGGLALPSIMTNAHSAGIDNSIKVGLIGCGVRGAGAASQALSADPGCVLTAMGDVFPDRLEESLQALIEVHPNRVKVDKINKFIGFDAYQKVIDSGVDVVLLATPPAFRPDHMEAAVKAGKHTFCEKPVAVDGPGVRKVLAAAKLAKEKNLTVVSGLCFRYDDPKRELFARVQRGDIGAIKSISTIRNGGLLWTKPRQAGWTDMEYKLRNWLYYTWLSGDFITEMMVHSLDMMAWAMGDKPPIQATGSGGRQVRTDAIHGNAYDHFAVEYEYENGVKGYHFSRQMDGCSNVNKVDIMGTEGLAHIGGGFGHEITGKNQWRFQGERNEMYQTEHDELFAAVRSGKPINNGTWMATSTMLAILGRMAAYTGQTITWKEALESNQVLAPTIDQYTWNLQWPGQEIARPGVTRVF
jgi:predicted dehydrogenase